MISQLLFSLSFPCDRHEALTETKSHVFLLFLNSAGINSCQMVKSKEL